LQERRKQVLNYIVDDYVETCTPVGSKRIAERLRVSPATVRNDMKSLLDEGYLEQPHTSAGRVPADMGYRYFVDYVLREYIQVEEDARAVRKSLDIIEFTIDKIFRQVSGLLTEWSDCVAFVCVPEEDSSEIRRIELSQVSINGLLMILILSNGLVENKLILLPMPVDRFPVAWTCRILNERLSGKKLREVTPALIEAIFKDIKLREDMLQRAISRFFEDMIFSLGRKVYIEGVTHLLKFPEFNDLSRLQPVLSVVDASGTDTDVFKLSTEEGDFKVVIGSENLREELAGCSIIKSNFRFGDRTMGTVGILGPKRMEYRRLIGLVQQVSNAIGTALQQFPRV